MHRKQFIKRMLQAGLCGCGAVMGFSRSLRNEGGNSISQDRPPAEQSWITTLEKRMIKGSETPAWRRVEKSESWIKDLMDNLDAELDEETKIKLMQSCGRACYTHAFGVAPEEKPTPEEARRYLEDLKKRGFKVRQEGDKTIIIYSWRRDHQNPWGLILGDGYCMCPIVETGPEGLSPTYCYCSTGYVKESFDRAFGKPVKVELLDSLKRGGKDCIFKIEIPNI